MEAYKTYDNTVIEIINDFWSSSHGWAPVEAAELLSKFPLNIRNKFRK